RRAEPWWRGWLGVPTGRLFALCLLPLAAALGVLAAPALVAPIVAFDLVLGAVALVDLVLAGRGRVALSRAWLPVQAVGVPFEVTLTLRNAGPGELRLRATDDVPGAVEGLPWEGRLPAGEGAQVAYTVTIDQRGQHGFGD